MRVLSIKKNGTELINSPVQKPILTIGRSPVCDIVIRTKGVRPIHFMLEWFGSDPVGGEKGKWSIVEINAQIQSKDPEVDALGFGSGKILDDKPRNIGGFDFSWVVDRLQPANFAGAFTESLEEHSASIGYSDLLEILEVDLLRESVCRVQHIGEFSGNRTFALRSNGPIVTFKWVTGAPEVRGIVLIRAKDLKSIIKIGGKLNQMGSGDIHIASNDVICITAGNYEYYIRFVAALELPDIQRSELNNPIYKFGGAFAALVIVLLLVFLVSYKVEEPVAMRKYTRIAKIDSEEYEPPKNLKEKAPIIQEVESTEVDPVEPPPIMEPNKNQVEPPTDVKTADIAKPPVESANSTKAKTIEETPAPPQPVAKVEPKPEPPPVEKTPAEPESNISGPDSNINSLGLLSALQSTAQVNKSDLSNSALSSAPSTEGAFNDGGVPISRSTTVGLLDFKGKVSKTDLSKAATGLQGSQQFLSKSSGAVSTRKGVSTGGNRNFGKGGGFAKDTGSVAVKGGLTRDQVREAVMTVQGEIRSCYESALITRPELQGKVSYRWVISVKGSVETVRLVSSELKFSQFEKCTMKAIEKIKFKTSSRPTEVVYPFIFK